MQLVIAGGFGRAVTIEGINGIDLSIARSLDMGVAIAAYFPRR